MKLRRIVALILVFASMFAFTSCGKKINDKDEQGRTIVSVGGYPTTEGAQRDNYDLRIKEFEEKNPDVVIKPDMWKFDLQTFFAKAAGNRLPNIYETNFTEVKQCIDSGYAADITDVLKEKGYDGKFNEAVLAIVSDDEGRVYGFPYNASLQGLAYNTKLFEAAGLMEPDGTPKQPKTWEEMRDFAIKIKEKTGKPGFVFPTSDNVGGWIFTVFAWSYGVEFVKQDADGNWVANFGTEECAEALQFIKDLKWTYDVLPNTALIGYSEYMKTYAVGNAGMMIIDNAVVRNVTQYQMDPEDIGMLPIPAGPKKHISLIAGSPYMFSNNSTKDQIEAGIRYIETYCNYDASDDFKENKQKEIQTLLERNQLVGIKTLPVWNKNTASVKYEWDLIEKNQNANPNHYKLYNDFVENLNIEIRPEEPVCAQELYATLDKCIQEVLTDKDSDCLSILKKRFSELPA